MGAKPPVADPGFLAEQEEAFSGRDRDAESDVGRAGKPDKPLPILNFTIVEAGKLGTGLNHHHAGEQGSSRKVSGDPELVISNVFISNDPSIGRIDVNDRVQMLHVPALGIALSDGFLIEKHLLHIDAGDFEEELRRHGRGARGGKTDKSMGLMADRSIHRPNQARQELASAGE